MKINLGALFRTRSFKHIIMEIILKLRDYGFSSQIIESLDDLELSEFQNMKKDFLLVLAEANKNKPDLYLGILYELNNLTKLDDDKKQMITDKIIIFYKNYPHIVIFNNELNNIKDELEFIINYNEEKREIPEILVNKFILLKQRVYVRLTMENGIELEINGEDIKSLGYKEGDIVGDILSLLKEKVEAMELENNKDKLIEYLRNNNLEELDNNRKRYL